MGATICGQHSNPWILIACFYFSDVCQYLRVKMSYAFFAAHVRWMNMNVLEVVDALRRCIKRPHEIHAHCTWKLVQYVKKILLNAIRSEIVMCILVFSRLFFFHKWIIQTVCVCVLEYDTIFHFLAVYARLLTISYINITYTCIYILVYMYGIRKCAGIITTTFAHLPQKQIV